MRLRAFVLPAALVAAAILAGCTAPPENLVCLAESDGNHLTWDPAENATSYRVYRGEAGSDFENATAIGNATDTSFHDADVVAGDSYRYWVTSVAPVPQDMPVETVGDQPSGEPEVVLPEEVESEPSEPCDVTAVPEFPVTALGAMALVGALGCYVALRRL